MLCEADCRHLKFGSALLKLQSNACVVCLSRLETRTKESNMCASHWELKTQRHNESKEFDCEFEERSRFAWWLVRKDNHHKCAHLLDVFYL